MSGMSKTRARLADKNLKPSWQLYHDLGAALMLKIPAHRSFEEIGAVLGITKQMAWHETAVALGKLAFRLRRQIPDWKNHQI